MKNTKEKIKARYETLRFLKPEKLWGVYLRTFMVGRILTNPKRLTQKDKDLMAWAIAVHENKEQDVGSQNTKTSSNNHDVSYVLEPYYPSRSGGKGSVYDSYESDGEEIQEDNWGGGFQSQADSNRDQQALAKGDFNRSRNKTLVLIIKVIRGEITKQKFKKLTGYGFDEMMNPSSRNWYANQIKRMSKKALAPVVPAAPAMKDSYESDGEDIQENVPKPPFEQALANIESFAANLPASDAKTAKLLRQIVAGVYNDDHNAVNMISLLSQYPTVRLFKELGAVRDYQRRFMPKIKESYGESYGGEDIHEKVDIDGRTRSYKNTVMRLEQLRQNRSNKTDNYKGLYDDGSGRGASLPNPISFNKESRSTMGIDGRANALKEALKRVESYRKMRDESKKKTLLGMKESDENMHEGTSLTRGQILDAVGMTNNKFEVTEEELSPKQKEYRAFFQKALKKHDAKSPADLDDGKKKKFFDYVKANWKG
jgi:hypothetical protein